MLYKDSMSYAERVTIFGDITGIRAEDIAIFVRETNHSYGGSYPSCREGLTNEEVVKSTRELLVKAGILNHSPITVCRSTEEKTRRILQDCSLRMAQNGAGLYWIIDTDPDSLVRAIRNSTSSHPDISRHLTIIRLNPEQPYDYVDQDTGVRLVGLLHYRFPTHPTPAS